MVAAAAAASTEVEVDEEAAAGAAAVPHDGDDHEMTTPPPPPPSPPPLPPPLPPQQRITSSVTRTATTTSSNSTLPVTNVGGMVDIDIDDPPNNENRTTTATAATATAAKPKTTLIRRFRDFLLRITDSKLCQIMGIVVMALVVIDGAFFFFLLVGWHNMCDTPTKTNCEPRNWWYNFSIQMLVALFTYMHIVSLPWRLSQLLHTYHHHHSHHHNTTTGGGHGDRKRRRLKNAENENTNTTDDDHDDSSIIGLDLDFEQSPDLWYHIPLKPHRRGILWSLLCSSLTQFINQATRIKFYSYELQNEYPATVWVNFFFVASFASAGIGGFWLLFVEKQIRSQHPPNTFPPGLLEVIQEQYEIHITTRRKRFRHCCCCANVDLEAPSSTTAAAAEGPTIASPSSTELPTPPIHAVVEDQSDSILFSPMSEREASDQQYQDQDDEEDPSSLIMNTTHNNIDRNNIAHCSREEMRLFAM